jgi:hypothetical protein
MINNDKLYNRTMLIDKELFLKLGYTQKHLYDIYHNRKIINIINNDIILNSPGYINKNNNNNNFNDKILILR